MSRKRCLNFQSISTDWHSRIKGHSILNPHLRLFYQTYGKMLFGEKFMSCNQFASKNDLFHTKNLFHIL